MKLLLDQNLSHKLVPLLQHLFAGSDHVRVLNLDTAKDSALWAYARQNGFTIVTKDAGFYNRSCLLGHPPKIVWLRIGNCSAESVANLLTKHRPTIERFEVDSATGCLELF